MTLHGSDENDDNNGNLSSKKKLNTLNDTPSCRKDDVLCKTMNYRCNRKNKVEHRTIIVNSLS